MIRRASSFVPMEVGTRKMATFWQPDVVVPRSDEAIEKIPCFGFLLDALILSA